MSNTIIFIHSATNSSPLLLTAGLNDQLVPPEMVRLTYQKYHQSPVHTDLLKFSDRSHWIIAQDGWDYVAGTFYLWLTQII